MTTISPTRVSMYDFLLQDMQPTVSLLADAAQLSLPQTRLGLSASLQAIIIALLAYEQRHQTPTVHKKLFTRGAVKELRQYSAMNFATIDVSLYHRNDIADAVFGDMPTVMKACAHIAVQIQASTAQVKTLITALCILVLRELAILADYSQLDHDQLAEWFALQPQFLRVAAVDNYWYELTEFQPVQADADKAQAASNYPEIDQVTENVEPGGHDLLVFAPMSSIELPHQLWLLQLAKTADIYLSRNRLRITSEPATTPVAPLFSLSLLGANKPSASKLNANKDLNAITTSEKPVEYNKSTPLWKNPAILIIILVIGGLSALAALKYQQQQSNGILPAAAAVYEHDHPKELQQQEAKTTANE